MFVILRPVDTQTIYQQSQEISNREQGIKQQLEMQQTQFSNILQKEVDNKQKSVNEVKKQERVNNKSNKKCEEQIENKKEKLSKNKKQNEKDDLVNHQAIVHIDIRI